MPCAHELEELERVESFNSSTADLPVRSTQSTLPDSSLFITWPTSQAPDITPAGRVLPRLAAPFENGFTSLGAFWAPWFRRTSGPSGLAQFPSASLTLDFWGSTRQAPPYPSAKTLSRFGTSLRFLTGKPLAGLSSLSFSRRGFSHPVPESCHRPGSLCRHKEAPDAGLR